MQIEVRKGIPIPTNKRDKYPWRTMEVGDSFLFPAGTLIGRAAAAASYANDVDLGTFRTRTITDGPDAGRIGCWRVA